MARSSSPSSQHHPFTLSLTLSSFCSTNTSNCRVANRCSSSSLTHRRLREASNAAACLADVWAWACSARRAARTAANSARRWRCFSVSAFAFALGFALGVDGEMWGIGRERGDRLFRWMRVVERRESSSSPSSPSALSSRPSRPSRPSRLA